MGLETAFSKTTSPTVYDVDAQADHIDSLCQFHRHRGLIWQLATCFCLSLKLSPVGWGYYSNGWPSAKSVLFFFSGRLFSILFLYFKAPMRRWNCQTVQLADQPQFLFLNVLICWRKPFKQRFHSHSAVTCEVFSGDQRKFFRAANEILGVKYIWNYMKLYCSCRCRWRVIIAVNFPI